MNAPPAGTRFVLGAQARLRAEMLTRLQSLYRHWGYLLVEVPALERYHPDHPRANQSFKLSDRDSGVLALRSDFTPALAALVQEAFPQHAAPADGGAAVGGRGAGAPLRLQYRGTLWHAIDPELARTREFTQVGLELVGVSNARADAELIHLARESVRAAGLGPRVELGNPGFVRALLDLAEVPEALQAHAADAIDRKDVGELSALLQRLHAPAELRRALLAVPDLYGDVDLLDEALELTPWPQPRRELARLKGVLAQFEDASELLVDLGMARRLAYYTGVTFRAYTPDYGQPLLGGGRYDGALLPTAAGFSLGLERLMAALPAAGEPERPLVLALHDEGARRLRAAGVPVLRALREGEAALREAEALGVRWLLRADGALTPMAAAARPPDAADASGAPEATDAERAALQALLTPEEDARD